MAAMARPDALKHKRQREVSASVSISCGMTWLFFGVATESNMVLRPTDVSSRCKLEKEELVVRDGWPLEANGQPRISA
jgi:hypothetical protein